MSTPDEKIQDLALEEVLGDRFGRYSKYIIQERALPDARDGLKPVQRRILFAMHVEGNTAEKGFRKSAKTVGNVIGNYHPHGDSSVYEAMVRMSQDWKVRNTLIEMHGNNGSVDGDPPAAMRYTEARTSKISSELLRDLDKETVDFVSNFDDTTSEPTVLPSRFPNLLVNGSTGISAGYATDIPPHNLTEVIEGVIKRLDKPDCTTSDIMKLIKGPDFPTGGIIQGIDGIRKAYETGKGRVVVRSKTAIEDMRGGRQQIVITEIPYEINKATLVKRMDDLRIDKKIEGISEVRDETDRSGLRIVIELKKDANADGVLNYLFKNTDLQISYNFNMVAIFNKRPQLMGVISMIDAYIAHQKEIITKRSEYDIRRAKARQHIIDGLMKALSILDEVIQMIRGSKDKRDAKLNLQTTYDFSEKQAEAIVSLQLYRLTNTDITQLQQEADELAKQISELEAILGDENNLIACLKEELNEIKKKYKTPRLTVIENEISEIKIDTEVLVASEDVVVSVTKEGYVKRTGMRSYAASNGEDLSMKETDHAIFIQTMNTMDSLLLFTSKGNYIYRPVHELPDIKWKNLGEHVSHLVSDTSSEEEVVAAIPMKTFSETDYFLFVTKNGMIKASAVLNYKPQRYSKTLMAINLKGEDSLISVETVIGNEDIFLASHNGYGLRYSISEVPLSGARTAGVKAMNLKADDFIVGAKVIVPSEKRDLVLLTQRGSAKRMKLSEFEPISRAKRGLLMLRELKNSPHRFISLDLADSNDIIHIATDKEVVVNLEVANLRVTDRYSNGSFIMDEQLEGAPVETWLGLATITENTVE
ncbi:DNA topoisomerase IV subunit A [Listeria newyorkensis]|uniref:DNA topoisomerase 4 subunit A n=1 Tax=Listeria newyorkensis TaxID=1497681 RepID=A0ABX4XR31_9LIST|nr:MULTISPECIES: DNA topoisomerase IV subunit A [Listeria]KGL45117.1 DNA gyrase subunit A [Listeriaceae bacterium FSL A5-0209]KGL40013.1 DNA gyrase subunit A [Listeria newyorkensis]KMT63608.1 DNA topoisomerase IV subunit A [Listeria newyorkensis]PNP93297.1 DNA topoisomerase IV subunit A [Listeria newyorkensis]RQW68241.1 DNA topoisomerase IV subunit A [Listeria sp. SHR_NRA_18]